MRLHLYSDIHLEFAPFIPPGGDHLLLAGDIIVAEYLRASRTDGMALRLQEIYRTFLMQCDLYKSVTCIMGNHEHYNGTFDDSANIIREFLKGTNVNLLEKQSIDLDEETVLYGATLWTSMNNRDPMVQYSAKQGMNDYHLIAKRTLAASPYGNGYLRFTPEDSILEHENTLINLKEFLEINKDKRVIVMTHMAPSSQSSHPRHGLDNPLNFCYYSRLEELILSNPQIKVWVHGHTHDSHDYMIGGTRVICNPRGYANPNKPDQQENVKFNINHEFEV